MKCRHCGFAVERVRGHWVDAMFKLSDGQEYSRARTCDASPVMARLHAPLTP